MLRIVYYEEASAWLRCLNHLIILRPKMNINITTNAPTIAGIRKESIVNTTDRSNSIAPTTGLTIPPVVNEEVARTAELLPFINVAVPPPAIIAIAHIHNGSISIIEAAITTVPAKKSSGCGDRIQ